MIRTRDLFYHLFRLQFAVIKHRVAQQGKKKSSSHPTHISYPLILFLDHLFCCPCTSLSPFNSSPNKQPASNYIFHLGLNSVSSVPSLGRSDTVTWVISASADVTDGVTKALLALQDSSPQKVLVLPFSYL